MGTIREGTISGNIPQLQHFAVKYPGYPTSLGRAIQTLGGEDSISKVRSSDTSYLELRFRPDDPQSHPAFGELHRTSGLLLQISRPSKKMRTDNSSSKGDSQQTFEAADKEKSPEIYANIVSQVHQAYSFDGLADYQYVQPLRANMADVKNVDAYIEKRGSTKLEEVMTIVPPLFSIKDMPEEIILRSSNRLEVKKKSKKRACDDIEIDFTSNPGIDFKVENVPVESTWHQSLVEFSNEWLLHNALAKFFEERPIWTKPMLWGKLVAQKILVTNYQFKRLLSKMAYHFQFGPFRTLWIKKGYDPRKDPESRRYQLVDFRVPRSVRESFMKAELVDIDKVGYWNALYAFKVVPRKRFSFFQLCDFEDDFVQTQVNKPPERNTCNEFSGWFRRSTLERIRQQVRLRFISLIPGDAARAFEVLQQKSLESFKSKQDMSLKINQSSPLEEDTSIGFVDTSNYPNILSHAENVIEKHAAGLKLNKGLGVLDYEDCDTDDDEDDNDDDDDDADDDEDDDEDDEEEVREDREELDDDEDEDEEEEEDESSEQFLEGQNHGDELEHGLEYPAAKIPENFLQALMEAFPASSEKQKLGLSQEFNFGEDDTEYSIYELEDDKEDND